MKNQLGGKRVLVTGGAGVIGRELLDLLSQNGADILSVDREALPSPKLAGLRHLRMDLAADSLDGIVSFKPQAIIHLAATFERSSELPDFWNMNWQDNVLLSHRLVERMKEMPGLEVFVFASSYLIYSPSLYLSPALSDKVTSLKEEDPVTPRNLCGAAKYYTESEIAFTRAVENLPVRTVNARIFRVYGCGSRDVVSRWIRAVLSHQDIEVYNKENRFDYIFARDVAEGLLRLAGGPAAQGTVNLGSGVSLSIQDVLGFLTKLSPTTKLKIQETGAREPFEASCADLTRLKQLTGWVPATDLEKGMRIVAEFEQGKLRKDGNK